MKLKLITAFSNHRRRKKETAEFRKYMKQVARRKNHPSFLNEVDYE